VKTRSIAIVGGGIGGLTLARFLAQDGHRVTVIERARDFSAQGHLIGFRGVGFEVMELLGLRSRAEQIGRGFRATRSYTMSGAHLRTVRSDDHARAVGGISVTQRGLLHAVLHEDLPRAIELRFGLKPVALQQKADSVDVSLSDGPPLRAELLVGADGANSAVRRLALPEVTAVDCGGVYAAMTVNLEHGLPTGEIAAYFGEARLAAFFPIDTRTVGVVIYQDDSYEAVPADNAPEAWAEYLKRTFVHSAEPVRRILGAVKPGDYVYHDRICLVPPKQVVSGRVALVGDAGYSPTFLSGNGSALSAVGACYLAKCLRTYDDDRAAYEAYQTRIVPFAAGYHVNAKRLRGILFEHSPWKNAVRRLAMRYAPTFIYSRNARRHYRGDVHLSDLM
jgi:2-polyprenyl-6-methoxyphenol hydroxylase-like FAD-dependent oxidoreductase